MGIRMSADTVHGSWKGPLASGAGTLSGEAQSSPLDNVGYSTVAVPGSQAGKTNPEELAAAAHSACFSMAFAYVLAMENIEPQQIDVSATVIGEMLDGGTPAITESNLKVRAQIPGLGQEDFARLVEVTNEKYCVVGKLFAGSAKVNVDAQLT